jgi:hypothetical protein
VPDEVAAGGRRRTFPLGALSGRHAASGTLAAAVLPKRSTFRQVVADTGDDCAHVSSEAARLSGSVPGRSRDFN